MTTHRHWHGTLILLGLLALGWLAARDTLLASIQHAEVSTAITQWQQTGRPVDASAFDKVRRASEAAMALQPHNALYSDNRAQVIGWGLDLQRRDHQGALAEMTALYQQSLQHRPTWPVSWASLARVKWRKGELDSDMLRYLTHAHRFGPAQPEVHRLFAELGLALYSADHAFFVTIAPWVKSRIALGLAHPLSHLHVKQAIYDAQAELTVCRWLQHQPPRLTAFLRCDQRLYLSTASGSPVAR